MQELLSNYYPILIFMGLSALITLALIFVPMLVAPSSPDPEKNAPYDKIFIEGSVEKVPDTLLKQLKEDGEIFTVIKNKEDNYVGEFIRGLKVESGISIEKFFNTNVNVLKDFII